MWGSNTSLKHAVFFNKAVLLFIIDSLTINVITPFEMRFEIWLDFSVFLVVGLQRLYILMDAVAAARQWFNER